MKKIAIMILICLLAVAGVAQSNVAFKKFVSGATVTTDTTFDVQTSALLNNYIWQVWAGWTGAVLAGTPYVKIQVSPDYSNWLDYPKMDSVAVSAASQNVAFEDHILPANYIRIAVTGITSGDTLKAFNVWYTLKRQ